MDVLLSDLICQVFHLFDTLVLPILDFLGLVKNCERIINYNTELLFPYTKKGSEKGIPIILSLYQSPRIYLHTSFIAINYGPKVEVSTVF